MNSNPWFVVGLFAGAAAGAAAVLLTTPMSGRETLHALRTHFQNARSEAREAGMRAEAEILSKYRNVRASSLSTPGASNLAPTVP